MIRLLSKIEALPGLGSVCLVWADGVVAGSSQRMASRQPPERYRAAADHAMPGNRDACILGAGRLEAAGGTEGAMQEGETTAR